MDHTATRKRSSNARVHKYLPYLVHQDGYQRFRETYGALHRYIQTKMEFLDISTLGMTYRYVVKIEHNIKQKRQQFGLGNPSHQNPGKGSPNPQKKKSRAKMDSIGTTSPRCKQRRTLEIQRKIPGSGATSIRALGIYDQGLN
jgi:hypothetical protein